MNVLKRVIVLLCVHEWPYYKFCILNRQCKLHHIHNGYIRAGINGVGGGDGGGGITGSIRSELETHFICINYQ